MMQEEFSYVAETSKSFDEAVVSLLSSIDKKGWVIFNVIDISERLAAKGFKHSPIKIVEICNGKYANYFLSKNRYVSLCMPCRINVLEGDGKVKIASMRPSIMSKFFSGIEEQEAEAVEKDIIEIIDNAK